MKRPTGNTRRTLFFDTLEARKLLAAGNDFYELRSDSDLYGDGYFLSTADPVIPSIDTTGRHVFDFTVNTPGDQTADITFADDYQPITRIKIDPTKSYQFAFIGYEGEGVFVVEAFASDGQSLGPVAVPYSLPALEGLNYFRYTNVHAMIGPAGKQMPDQTAWIDLVSPPQSPYTRFGFVEDYAFSFQSDRSVDQLKSPVTLGVDPAQSYRLSATAINQSSVVATDQLHSLGYLELDADRQLIEPIHTQKYGTSADARLASPLNPGDMTITLTSTDGWSNTSYDPSTRALAWYGYRDSAGTLYADFTYTRNVARDAADGMWNRGGINGNRLTLNKPWSGPALPVGAAIRNAVDGDPLVATLLDYAPIASTMNVTLHGQWTDGTPLPGQFAPGTRYLQLAATLNQSSVAKDERIAVRMQFDRNDGVVIATPDLNSRVVTLDVLANDGAAATEIVGISNGKLGTVEIAAGGRQLIYRSQDYFIGTDSFTYDSADSAGVRVTRQVQIKSLGGNLDSDSALRIGIETAAQSLMQYQPNVQLPHHFAGVKDQTLSSSLYGNYNPQPHSHRLDEIGFQAGAFSLQANGDFVYHPIAGAAYKFPFLSTASNGSEDQPVINFITLAESEFRRDQVRLGDIGLAVENLTDANRYLFPADLPLDTNGRPFLSWRVHLLPYLGYRDLYNRFKQDEPWDSSHNLSLLAEMPDVFRSASDGPEITSTRFQVIASSEYPSSLRFLLNNADGRGDLKRPNQITDGIQHTLLVVQAGADKAIPWTQNVDLPYVPGIPMATLGNVGNYFNAYLWGQRVRALATDMDQSVFQGLATAAQGDFADPEAVRRQAQTRPDFPGDGYNLNTRTQESQMKTVLLAMHNHESAFKRLAPQTPASGNLFSWRVWLLPFLGHQSLFEQFRMAETWDSPHNLSVAAQMPDIYRSLGDAATTTTTRLRVLGGPNMAYGKSNALQQGPRWHDFADGTSNSILIVEAGTDKAVPWTMPEVLPVDVANFWTSMGNLPAGNMLMGMADGSMVRAARSTANELMIGMATINQGDSNRAAFQAAQPVLLPSTPMQTSNDLKQIGLAAHMFEQTYKFLPMNFSGVLNTLPSATNVGLSWRVAILPFIDESALFDRFHLNEPWDSPHNLSLLPLMPNLFKSGNLNAGDSTTRVQRFSGPGTIDPNQKLRLNQITDGTSNTIFAGVIAAENAVPWTKPDDIDFPIGGDWAAVGNTEFLPALMADGSVTGFHYDRALGLSTSRTYETNLTFEMLVTRNDNSFEAPRTQTIVIAEGTPFAFNFSSARPLILEFESPGLAQVASRSDGFITGYGAQQRITLEAINDRNGKRQTKLFIKTPHEDPNVPPGLLQTIDVIIVENDKAPTLNPIGDIVIAEDLTDLTLNLDGISPGRREQQGLALSARSLSTSLIDNVAFSYQPGSSTATLSLSPLANQSGIGIVEVVAMDAGADGDLQTTSDNSVIRRTFTVTVQSVNDAPAADPPVEVVLPEDSGSQQTTITGIGPGPGETQPLRVTATTNSLLLSLASTNLIVAGTSTTLRWTPVADRYGQAVVLVQIEDGGLDDNLATTADNAVTTSSLTINLTPKNDAPTIDRPANQRVLEDSDQLIVPLENIGAGPYELDEVLVSAMAGNSQLVQELSVERAVGSSTGTLLVKPQPDQSGATMITLRVEDGGTDGDLATEADNLVTVTAFEFVIQPVNDAPELNGIDGVTVDVNSADVVVPLSGITAGRGEVQPLRITATSDAPNLISAPRVQYVSGTTATLQFSTLGVDRGQGVIRVVVEDGGLDNDLNTTSDNLSVTRELTVTVNVPPMASDDRYRKLSGHASTLSVLDNDVDIGDTLKVVVTQAPAVDQATVQVNADGTLLFVPADGFAGVVNFGYRVIDQHGRSSAIAQVIVGVAHARYQNPFNTLDVNSDGHVSPLDALLIINVLNDPNHPKSEAEYTGDTDLDTNGDGAFSAIDALLVINELNK